ncbi:hypothetical protein E4U60_004772 [Claviceps pazoutovae]|uniref:Uncharacterized protein n=1 Tax=Claviceps pazoutovae TaxID=1649127 RepID=A0A9P7MKE9_9HYPO|nr:hypothetical protein E4U60_004772 [Claviceps pazoutovae]
MAAAGITGSGGVKNARYIRDMDTRGIRDIPAEKNDDQASVNPRAKIGHHDLVKSRPGSRGGGSGGCDGEATTAVGATSTETETQSETTTATGSATVTASTSTGDPMTDFSGQGSADGKIAVRNAPRYPPSTPLLKTKFTQSADSHEAALDVERAPVTTSSATAPAFSPSAASTGGNRVSTSVAITIALATIAGLALILATLFFCKVCRRRRRSGRPGSSYLQDDPEKNNSRKSKLAISAPSAPIPLETLPPSLTYPPAPPALAAPIALVTRSAPAPIATATPGCLVRPSGSSSMSSFKDVQGGGIPWWRKYDVGLDRADADMGMKLDKVKALNHRPSIPPPMLMDRKLHPSISGSTLSIASAASTPTLHRGHVRGRHTPLIARNCGVDWQLPILPIMAVQPPLRSVRPGATMSSTSSIQPTTHELRTLTSIAP